MSASTTSWLPWTRFMTPGGNPHRSMSSKTFTWETGTVELGLFTYVLPQATAYGMYSSGTSVGKLKDGTMKKTPIGTFVTVRSMLGETVSCT